MQAPPLATMSDPESGAYNSILRNERTDDERTDNHMFSSNGLDVLCCCFNTCFIVPERTSVVQLLFGSYAGTITKPGCYCRNSCFVQLQRVSNAVTPIELPNIKVADSNGNPLIVSGIVTYEITDSRRAAIDVPDARIFVQNQAPAVLKRVISQYPYDIDNPDIPCLRKEPQVVSVLMKESLQERVTVAGVRIESFAINELSYAPEIAQSMLKRQQAGALIEARQRIVRGAAEIAKATVHDKELADMMSPQDRSRLMSNLLVVLVSEKDASPVLEL